MAFPSAQPGVSQQQEVVIDGYAFRVLPGTYKRAPAPRFGEKISTGDLRYQDFNAYESAASYSTFEGGFGLRRFSDLPQGVDPQGYYAETFNVDARLPGVCLSPALNQIVFTNSGAVVGSPPAARWFGEWTPTAGAIQTTTWVEVSGNATGGPIWQFTSSLAATSSTYVFANSPIIGGIVASGSQLMLGFGSATQAQYVTTLDGSVPAANVTDTATNQLYVYAAAMDRAAIYIAGGAAVGNTNTVLSASVTAVNPMQSFSTAANAVTCGDTSQPITAIAPGGGIAGVLLFVCKTGELGYIDTSATYHTIQPFTTRLASNGVGMKWWMGGINGSPMAGPMKLVFPVSRSLWSWDPSNGPMNMAPQSRNGFRPINARGVVSAIQGSDRFLYYAVNGSQNNPSAAAAQCFIVANDGVMGSNHTYRAQPGTTINAMGITSLFGSNPLLYFDTQPTIGGPARTQYAITMPSDGDWPPGDVNCTYDTGLTNYLLLPDIDFGFGDEDKIPLYLRITADNLSTGASVRQINAFYATDGSSTYTFLGTFNMSPQQDIVFTSPMAFKRMSIKLVFFTGTTTQTPILYNVSLRASINPKQYSLWTFDGVPSLNSTKMLPPDLNDAAMVIEAMWNDYTTGVPVPFTDRWNKQWSVRVLDFQEAELSQEDLKTPETKGSFTLLQVTNTGLESAWDSPTLQYDNLLSAWS